MRRALGYPAAAFAVSAGAVGALWLPLTSGWPQGGPTALTYAGGLGFLAAWVGHRAGEAVVRRVDTPSASLTAHLVGMGVRMLLTLVAALVVVVSGRVEKFPFGIAISVVYLSLLALEVFVSLRAVGQNHAPQDREAAHRSAPESDDEDARNAPQGDRET